MIKRSGMDLYFKTLSKGKAVQMVISKSLRVFLRRTRLIKTNLPMFSVYLKVGYGKHKDNFGKLTDFDNSGTYKNKEDFTLAVNAFLEK